MRFLLILLLCQVAAWGQPVTVNGQTLAGPTSGRGESLFVSLEELARALHVTVVPVNEGWYVSRRTVTAEQVRVEPEQVVVEDVIVESREEDGQRLVHLRQFARALGAEVSADGRVTAAPPGRKMRRVNPGDVGAILKGPREATELPGPAEATGLVPINQPGAKVVLRGAAGKTTVVYFMTPWNAECKSLGPRLQQFFATHPELALVVVDIARQNSPVARQYKIGKVPSFLVFYPTGRVQVRGEKARQWVTKLLK